jgi:acyl-coenzyme A synthetase/AMP-(fatty) acid ligase
MIERIHFWAKTQPKREALVQNGTPVDYATFWRLLSAIHKFLGDQQLAPGRTALVLVNNLTDAWLAALALRWLGLNTVQVTTLQGFEKLGLNDVACVLVTEAELPHLHLQNQALAGVPLLMVTGAVYREALAGPLPQPAANPPPFGGHYMTSSGSTGSYRPVFADTAHAPPTVAEIEQHWRLTNTTRYHNLDFPLWTVMGFRLPASVWWLGGCVLFDQRPNRLALALTSGADTIFVLPDACASLLAEAAKLPGGCTDILVFTGGGFLNAEILAAAPTQLTHPIRLIYGSTESGCFTASAELRTAEDLLWLHPTPARVLEVVNEAGHVLPADEEGELRVRLRPHDPGEYHGDPATSARHFRDGCFYPGDVAMLRADGRVRILGRVADVLNVAGRKLAVAPIEDQLRLQLGATTVCLFARLADDGVEELGIALEAPGGPSRETKAAVAAEFPSFGRIRWLVLPELPRTDGGMRKVQRAALRHMVFASRSTDEG